MNIRTGFFALALATGGALAAYAFTAQAPSPEDMKKFMEAKTPGEEHKMLADKAGKWNLKVKMMMPGQPASESAATAEIKWVLDGLWLDDETTGTFDGMPFSGHGHAGYDKFKKKYVSTWMDNMSSGLMISEGTYDAATKTLNYEGMAPDCMVGKYVKTRITEKMTDKDHWVMTMYSPDKDGKEYKSMEIDYTRAK